MVAIADAPAGLRIVDTVTGQTRTKLFAAECARPVTVAWSPTGSMVAIGSDDAHVCAFEAATGRVLWTVGLPLDSLMDKAWVNHARFTNDGLGLLVGVAPQIGPDTSSHVRLLRAANGESVRDLGLAVGIGAVDGDIILGNGEPWPWGWIRVGTQLSVWTVDEPKRAGVQTLGMDDSGKRALGVRGDDVVVWDARSGDVIYQETPR